MKIGLCVFVVVVVVLANFLLPFDCRSQPAPDTNRNFYLTSVTNQGEVDKYVQYNEITAKESLIKSPNDR